MNLSHHRRPPIPRIRRVRTAGRLVAGLGVLLLAAGCTPRFETADSAERTERVIAVALENIDQRYVAHVPTEALAMAGLAAVAAGDDSLALSRTGDRITLTHNTTVIGHWQAPPAADFNGWASVSAQAVDRARTWSSALAQDDPEQILARYFRAGFDKLDRYTRYATPNQARNTRARREGFGGLGITIRYEEGKTFVRDVHEGTPAAEAGLKAGDLITHVGETVLAGLDQRTVVGRLRGPVHSTADLTVHREGLAGPLRITVVRAHIILPTVTAMRENGILILRITGFNQGTTRSVGRELAAAERDLGAGLKGMVLDLRSNPGGLLDQAVAVADYFLNDGRIISTRGRHRRANQIFDASWGERIHHLPIALLINGRSASASEIVAAALRDRGRAIVIGASSFGKGSVQTIIRLPNAGELTLTWAHMVAPSGFSLQDHGIIPAICTSDGAPGIGRLVEAIRKGGAAADALLNDRLARREALRHDPGKAREACPPSKAENAEDLEIARYVLGQPHLYTRVLTGGGPAIAQR